MTEEPTAVPWTGAPTCSTCGEKYSPVLSSCPVCSLTTVPPGALPEGDRTLSRGMMKLALLLSAVAGLALLYFVGVPW
jgi:hypothetical protein